MAQERQVAETSMSQLPEEPPEAHDQFEDDDYFRRLGEWFTMPKIKFRLGTLMFITACFGVVFTPLQFLRLEDLPTVLGLAVLFMATLFVLVLIFMPRSSEE
jgi:hypothetical protein